MKQIFGFDGPGKNQSQAIISRRADFHETFGLVGDAQHVLFRHWDRPAGDVADDIGLDFLHHVETRNLADARARYAAGMNLDFYPARVRPTHVAFGLAVGQQAVIVEDEFDQLDSESMNLVKILFRQKSATSRRRAYSS